MDTNKMKRGAQKEMREAKSQLQKNLNSSEWRWNALILSLVIAGYFISSLTLTFFQKHLISHLRFPITIVTCHLVLKFCLASLCRKTWTSCTDKPRVVLSWSNYMSKVALVAIFSALDIGLSQWSFEFITVSLYTMTKTTAVLFILFFALVFKLEKKHWSLILIVSMISFGLFLFVYHSTTFHFLGFCMVLSASVISGARWTLAQLIMQKSKLGLENPIDFIYHIQPIMILTLLPFAAGFEGVSVAASEHAFRFHSYSDLFSTLALVFVGGFIAFVMEISEFFIITKASSLTLSIVGITKEIGAILLDVVINQNYLSPINILGVIICLSGIGLHIFRKASRAEYSSKNDSHSRSRISSFRLRRNYGNGGDSLPLLSDNSDSESSLDDFFQHHHGFPRSKSESYLSPGKRYRDFDDDFFLRDNRQWTSVKDSHVRMSREGDLQLEERNSVEVPSVLLSSADEARDGPTSAENKNIILADID